MDKENIWSSITRKISGENTSEDSRNIEEWLGEKPENRQVYVRLEEVWKHNHQTASNNTSLFESIKRRIYVHDHKPGKNFFKSTIFKVAAVLAIIIATNYFVYNIKPETKVAPLSWQEINVPRGNRMKIVLPDSTSIWLNNETKLRYASNFSSGNREVELSGEAYFEVKHDSENPFTVKIGNRKIKVLGTKFSVNAYPEDQIIETSLISGSVQFQNDQKINGISDFMLEPGSSMFYDKKNNSISTQKIQSTYYQYWENGVYAFKDEKFENLALKIRRIFNIEIVFEDSFLKSKTYTGTININDNIFLFMEAIRRTSVQPIEYKFNKNIIYVKLKQQKKV